MKITNTEVYGLGNSIKASKFPMSTDPNACTTEITKRQIALGNAVPCSGHDCFLKGILVQFDMTFSIKMSVELERYHFIDFVSSQSTMHCVTKFDIKKQCNGYVDDVIIDKLQEIVDEYNSIEDKNSPLAKETYLRVLYNVPVGFELTARLSTNYLQLKSMYNQRKGHRLHEWNMFCNWCKTLPMFKELVLEKEI